jgi:hypothetical protein
LDSVQRLAGLSLSLWIENKEGEGSVAGKPREKYMAQTNVHTAMTYTNKRSALS